MQTVHLSGIALLFLMMGGCVVFATDTLETKALSPRIQFWGIWPEGIEEDDNDIKVKNGVQYTLVAELLRQEAPLAKVRAWAYWEGGSWGKGGVSPIEQGLSHVKVETFRVYPEGNPHLAQTHRLFNLFAFKIDGEKKEHGERRIKFEIIVIDKEGKQSNRITSKTFIIE